MSLHEYHSTIKYFVYKQMVSEEQLQAVIADIERELEESKKSTAETDA